MLGYILSVEDVLDYYGGRWEDIPEAIFKYGADRETVMVLKTGVLSRGGGDGPGFKSPEDILDISQMALDGQEGQVLRNYPAFHGTVGRYEFSKDLLRRRRTLVGSDMVFDIDVKTNYKEAFKNGAKIVDFLDRYDVSYRIKFSGGTGPHIILPYEIFPKPFSRERLKQVSNLIIEASRAQHVDGTLWPPGHFLRLPYSLNENTGLVSLPLSRDQFESFEPSIAEMQNVEVNESWFQLSEDAPDRFERFLTDAFGLRKRESGEARVRESETGEE